MLSESEKINSLIILGIQLIQVNDLDILMQKILTEARRFINAEAGSIYKIKNSSLEFSYTQNDFLQSRLPSDESLIYSTFTIPVNNESIAGYVALTGQPLSIPDVYQISSEKPYNFTRKMDQLSGYRSKSMVTVPLQNSKGNVLGILQVINAKNKTGDIVSFSKEAELMMLHFANIAVIALERAQMTRAIIMRTIRMTQLHDPQETFGHVNRVGAYAVELYYRWAKKHAINKETIDKNADILRMAAMLHDVGKIAISDLILKKPGRFNYDEYEIMKQHTVLGAKIFHDSQTDFDEAAYNVALNHHERWDGSGYPGHVDPMSGAPVPGYTLKNGSPRGKKGTEIPLFGRIVSLVDVYDALSSRRSYKEAWEEERTLKAIQSSAGSQFDPEMVTLFLGCINTIRSIHERYADD
ncbi:MAG: metal dependent phosphohydrolase [Candidatus Magnetoglobus multicellularis str. Araruama]|uniref:Metal dependent phosphohydrolase n=1 Tax=Candidatus Magnetoglobus multicellularis str. Araruama TaxID=890399 RepID=A0A1V1P644_9BACT|nr:MAG: metal dependent phosphohydrolase [Candidatus Magnetoglobus multicellularis str. Araruama]